MIDLDIRSALDAQGRVWLAQSEKHIRFATALALTRTAMTARDAVTREILKKFRAPVKMTREAVRVRMTDRHLPLGAMKATVYIRDEASKGTPPSKYLAAEIEGGARRDKRSERALMMAGLLEPDQQTAASSKLRNKRLSGQLAVQMLSGLKAFHEMGFVANATRRTEARKRKARVATAATGTDFYPARKRGEDHPYAIFQLVAPGKVRPILWLGRAARYTARLPFWQTVQKTAMTAFGAEMRRALVDELRTRRS